MPRLMDVDVFKENLDKEFETATDAFDAVDFALEDTPTIDAVPVVRCKDCRYAQPTIDGRWICGATTNPNWVSEEHFCSYGEPRGERKE